MAKIEIAPETTFEAALQELETLLKEMESGNLPLEELISRFERGNALSQYCRKKLDSLEKRIEVLVKDDGDSGEWREFSDSGDTPPDTPRR